MATTLGGQRGAAKEEPSYQINPLQSLCFCRLIVFPPLSLPHSPLYLSLSLSLILKGNKVVVIVGGELSL